MLKVFIFNHGHQILYHHSVAPWVFVGKLKANMYTLILQKFVNIKCSYVNNDSRIV